MPATVSWRYRRRLRVASPSTWRFFRFIDRYSWRYRQPTASPRGGFSSVKPAMVGTTVGVLVDEAACRNLFTVLCLHINEYWRKKIEDGSQVSSSNTFILKTVSSFSPSGFYCGHVTQVAPTLRSPKPREPDFAYRPGPHQTHDNTIFK
ncbi:hypothetical protein ACI65C_006266 [Semiaphis heraclei]